MGRGDAVREPAVREPKRHTVLVFLGAGGSLFHTFFLEDHMFTHPRVVLLQCQFFCARTRIFLRYIEKAGISSANKLDARC